VQISPAVSVQFTAAAYSVCAEAFGVDAWPAPGTPPTARPNPRVEMPRIVTPMQRKREPLPGPR
jgi:hypothetical protein